MHLIIMNILCELKIVLLNCDTIRKLLVIVVLSTNITTRIKGIVMI